MLSLTLGALAYSSSVAMRPAVGRAASPVMSGVNTDTKLGQSGLYGYSKGEILFDPFGEFGGKLGGEPKKLTSKLLSRVEELKVLSSLADAGVLSSLEASGTFSKLEASGTFSKIEKLLPLADDLKLLSIAETLLNVPAFIIGLGAVALVAGEVELLTILPDDLLALQVASGVIVGLLAPVLLAVAALFSLLQTPPATE